ERLLDLADDLTLDAGGFRDVWHGRSGALGRYERAAREHPAAGRAWHNLGYAQLRADEPDDAIESFAKAMDLGFQPAKEMYNLACAHARAGHRDEALQWLERSADSGFAVGDLLAGDRDLDALRGHERFRALRDRLAAEH